MVHLARLLFLSPPTHHRPTGDPSFGLGGGEGKRVAGGAVLPSVATPDTDAALPLATTGGDGRTASPAQKTCGGGGGGLRASAGVDRSVGEAGKAGGFGRLVSLLPFPGEAGLLNSVDSYTRDAQQATAQ